MPWALHERIVEKKARYGRLRTGMSRKALGDLMGRMEAEFVYNSNKIEGSTLTRGETDLVLQGVTVGRRPLSGIISKSLDDIRAAGNHPGAMDLIRRLAFDASHRISEREIRSVHGLLMRGIVPDAGAYRTDDRAVRGAEFVPPPPYEVGPMMKKLADFVNCNPDELTPVELAAQAHYDLAWIHPFSDGNGRTARLVMNFILLRNGYPFTIVRDVERKTYLGALRRMDTEGDIEPFTTYVARCVEQTLDMFLQETGRPDLLPLGRIDAVKKGKTWMSTRKIIAAYVAQQKRRTGTRPGRAKTRRR